MDSHSDPAYLKLSHDEALAQHLHAQQTYVQQNAYDRRLRQAKLKYPSACIENIDYRAERGLVPAEMAAINSLSWVDRCQNLFFIGPAGSGKTYLACAQGENCVRHEHSVLSYRLPLLLESAEIAKADGSMPKLRNKMTKCKILIIEDFALSPITPQGRLDLLEFIECRTNTGSIIITSQLPPEKWHDWLGEPTIADAILDRLVHRAYIINLKGDSMRKIKESVKEAENV